MGVTIYQVDAFTGRPFAGNPAAVCILPEPGDEAWMQSVAREMNLSETAFLHRQEDGFDLRWFTPAVEVALCGHATLASAHILWETGLLAQDEEARFHTASGLLTQENFRVPEDECKGNAGAGDAFSAGFLHGTHQEWPIEKSLKFAAAAAAISLGDESCTGAMQHQDYILNFMNRE